MYVSFFYLSYLGTDKVAEVVLSPEQKQAILKGSVEFKQKMRLLPGTVQYDSYKDLVSLELFEQEEKNSNIIEYGMGTFVSPKPNRLVLINSSTVHGITRVDPDAGQNIRLTLTGFYNIFSKDIIKNGTDT